MVQKSVPHSIPRRVCLLLCVFGTLLGATLGARPACAQRTYEDKSELLRRVVVAPDAVYVPLDAETLCGPTIESLVPSPSRANALIARQTAPPVRELEQYLNPSDTYDSSNGSLWSLLRIGQGEEQLLLYGPANRRGTIVWRSATNTSGFTEMHPPVWLPTSQTAYAVVRRKVHGAPGNKQRCRDFLALDAHGKVDQDFGFAFGQFDRLHSGKSHCSYCCHRC